MPAEDPTLENAPPAQPAEPRPPASTETESPATAQTAGLETAPVRSEQQDAFTEQQEASDLVSKAQSFLESSELKEADAKNKAQYLAEKGLPVETIDELQKAIASIPVVPPRTYPEALVSPVRSRLSENLVTLYYFFTYAAGASALLTWVYSKFIFPRWVMMILAKRRLREHQAGLMKRLKDELESHKENALTASTVAPNIDTKPAIASRLQELREQVPDVPPKTTRQHTLQSLSGLTGYLSSQIHLSSALDAAARTYQFQFSMPGAIAGAAKNDINEQLKKDIRALKGLLINRRTFLQSPSATAVSTRAVTPAR